MLASNTYVRSSSVAVPSADGCRASSVVALACVIVVIGAYCFCPSISAQTSDSPTTEEPTKPWTATTDLKSDDLMPERIPVRIVESHSQNGNRTLDKRSVEIHGTDGHFEPYQDIERETLTVDASTVKTTMRTFDRDVNGKKALVQVTEEEKHILSGHDSNTVRVTYNPDLNGRLQPVQREIVETKTISKDLEETNATVMLTNINGGLAPAFKTRELRKRTANDTVETEKTTWLPDGNGGETERDPAKYYGGKSQRPQDRGESISARCGRQAGSNLSCGEPGVREHFRRKTQRRGDLFHRRPGCDAGRRPTPR